MNRPDATLLKKIAGLEYRYKLLDFLYDIGIKSADELSYAVWRTYVDAVRALERSNK